MAQKVQVELIDDLDGESPAQETVWFGLDGKEYEIDLTDKHALALRENLEDYITAGRRAGSRSKTALVKATNRNDPERVQAVREWAKAHGLQVADRGRVPANVWQAFQQAS
jgi:hypothetical protein